ncbi:peptidoglycan-binding domain-containing protein [Kineosporia babensis]|uniref:Peptidoglycan-binding protein n=1 Tax=Kineosporia babensis TaxID=499548 RepID=A0A9X1NJY6_9ACTN|nr:peptidoglycan-binding domain-containing protein [Kineosporia babensis]MCD5315548.1 peptidoglycan-binding protein [Kineosporia babensis]
MSEKIQLGLPLLKKGSSEVIAVRRLQELLNHFLVGGGMLAPLKVDGDFGAKTEEAVEYVQKWAKLVVDGDVGAKTWTWLLNNWFTTEAD